MFQNATLKGFSGMFAISVQHPESSEVHGFTKTCHFSRSEYIRKDASAEAGQVFSDVSDMASIVVVCSSNSWMTVTVDLLTVKTVVNLAGTHLLNKNCRPKETEGTRVQFSFSLNKCGTTLKVGPGCP